MDTERTAVSASVILNGEDGPFPSFIVPARATTPREVCKKRDRRTPYTVARPWFVSSDAAISELSAKQIR